jgi:Ala-tRNA(Pro) deacylase
MDAWMQPDMEVVMTLPSLTRYLDANQIAYIIITHSPAYTAQGIAGLAHIPGKELAKTVIVKLDGNLAMAVLPASYFVDLVSLRRKANAKSVALASEDDFKDRFPECETGAMPPFGNLYGLPVFADESLENDREIVFNAGTHRELIRMAWVDYKKLAEPIIVRFAAGRHAVAA